MVGDQDRCESVNDSSGTGSPEYCWLLLLLLQVGTLPQGVIDMNQCSDVRCAEVETSHQFSIAVVTTRGTTYIKGSSREEISR